MSDAFDTDTWSGGSEFGRGRNGQGARFPEDSNGWGGEAFNDQQDDWGDKTEQHSFGYQDGYEDGFGEYGDSDDDDEYGGYEDDYEEQGEGGGLFSNAVVRKLLAAGAVVFLFGAIAVLISSTIGGDSKHNTADPISSQSTEVSTSTTQAQTTSSTTIAVAPASPPPAPPQNVVDGMNKALTAWGKFEISGNVADISPFFVKNGNEIKKLTAEAPAIGAKHQTGPPLSLTMNNFTGTKIDVNNWLIKGTVASSRPGAKPGSFGWEIRMTRTTAGGPFLIADAADS